MLQHPPRSRPLPAESCSPSGRVCIKPTPEEQDVRLWAVPLVVLPTRRLQHSHPTPLLLRQQPPHAVAEPHHLRFRCLQGSESYLKHVSNTAPVTQPHSFGPSALVRCTCRYSKRLLSSLYLSVYSISSGQRPMRRRRTSCRTKFGPNAAA